MENLKLTAQIAAAYMPCKITDKYANGVHYDMVGVSEYEGNLQVKMPSGDTDWWNIDMCQLLLTPLSSITDEDAIEVAKIDLGALNGFEVIKVKRYNTSIEIDYRWISDNESLNLKDGYSYSGWGMGFKPQTYSPQITDYLRSKSYDCGYGSIPSLLTAAIAINNEVKK